MLTCFGFGFLKYMLRWECLTCKCKASTLPDRPRSIVSLENIRGFNNNNLCLLISTLISRKMHGMAPMLSPGFCSSCVGLVLSKQHIVGCGLSVSVRHGWPAWESAPLHYTSVAQMPLWLTVMVVFLLAPMVCFNEYWETKLLSIFLDHVCCWQPVFNRAQGMLL